MLIPRQNCIYFCDFGRCSHKDMRYWFGSKKSCVLGVSLGGKCDMQIQHKKPPPPPVPPRKVK